VRDEIPQLVSGHAHPPVASLGLDERGLRIEEDVAASSLPGAVRADLGLGAFICARITRGQESAGVLLIGYRQPRPIEPEMQQVVRGLASQLSIAIENAHLFEQLEQAALTDSSTGLRNMRFFWAALESELVRAKRMAADHGRDEPLSVLMMDLNKFKQYNDEYGHPVGDEALRRFGQLIQSVLRRYDTLARYGGDEFIVLLPETGAEGAAHLADRLRQKVAQTLVRLSDTVEVKFSSSIGVATYPQDGTTAQALVRAADDALYAEKRRGGNLRATTAAG
jgi:two-component system cell cycle response regulator